MSGLDDIVNVVISSQTQQVSRRGFGTPMILGCSNRFPEPCRTYSSTADMTADGFLVTDPEYLAASAIKAQSPSPATFKVARRENKPTLSWLFTPKAKNGATYTLVVDGQEVSFTADENATVAEILEGLITAGTAKAIPGIAFANHESKAVKITSSAAGAFHTVTLPLRDIARGLGDLAQNNADGGIATDLASLLLYDSDWYALCPVASCSSAELIAAAAWCGANERIMVASSQDSEIVTAAAAGATDVAAALKTAGYARSTVIYHPKAEQFAGAAWLGRCLPLDPGSETWAFKQLAGVDVGTELTPSHVANAEAKNASVYGALGGLGQTRPGKVAAGEWIDVIRFRDWLKARLQEDVFVSLARAEKVPFTDKGIALIEKDVRSVLQEGVEVGGLEAEFTVTVPKASAVSRNDKAARTLNAVRFEAFLAGAIHAVQINGVLSYSGT